MNLFVPQQKKSNFKYSIPEQDKDLINKPIVFTGGTDGIGRVAVDILHQMSADLILLGRNKSKGELNMQELTSKGQNGKVNFQLFDLSSMQSVKDCANHILAAHNRIDNL